MFAGPNGSGKSTMIEGIQQTNQRLVGLFLNADNLEKDLKLHPILNLAQFHKSINPYDLIHYIEQLKKPDGTKFLVVLPKIIGYQIDFTGNIIDSYLAGRVLDFIREKLLELKVSFTFETVMSHSSKIDFLQKAKACGYRTYLYFVTTEDADINVSRVSARVVKGGHSVDEVKIRERYDRTMSMLMDAIDVANRTYLFDNSKNLTKNVAYIAEIENGQILKINPHYNGTLPIWFVDIILPEFV